MLSINSREKSVNIEMVDKSLEAISSTGKVIFVTYRDEDTAFIKDYIGKSMPHLQDKFLVFQENNPTYPFLRDLASGWQKTSDGKYRLINNPAAEKGSDQVGRLSNLLAFCTNRKIEFSSHNDWNNIDNGTIAGGEIVSDGAGTCILPADSLSSDVITKINCSKIIKKPTMNEKAFNHKNYHTDIAVSFLAPGVALVSDVDKDCKDSTSQKVRAYFDEFARSLLKEKVQIIRQNLALGCPKAESLKSTRIVRDDSRAEFLSRGDELDASNPIALRSYTNLTQVKDAYLVPNYLGPTYDYKSNRSLPTDHAITKQMERDNNEFRSKLLKLMDDGVIPKKKILEIPVEYNKLIGGSGYRCLSWEIPDDLSSCNQENFDLAMSSTIAEVKMVADCTANSPNSKNCRLARSMYKIINYTVNSEMNPDYNDKLDRNSGTIKASGSLLSLLREEIAKMEVAIRKFCQGF